MDDQRKLTVRLDSALLKRFRMACLSDERQQQEVVAELIEQHLRERKSRRATPTSPTRFLTPDPRSQPPEVEVERVPFED
jgi:hypothetical protein